MVPQVLFQLADDGDDGVSLEGTGGRVVASSGQQKGDVCDLTKICGVGRPVVAAGESIGQVGVSVNQLDDLRAVTGRPWVARRRWREPGSRWTVAGHASRLPPTDPEDASTGEFHPIG